MSTTFGYLNAWAKNGLKTIIEEEFQLADEIVLSGSINIKPDMAQALIEYLSDPTNADQYGTKLDFALFYKEEGKVKISGKITTPYRKDTDAKSNGTSNMKSRRMV